MKRAIEIAATGRIAGENLARLRKARRYSVRELAARLTEAGRRSTGSGISKIERGERRMDVDDLVALAAVLDVSPSALLLPPDDNPSGTVEVTGAGKVPADVAWDWMDGKRPLLVNGEWQASMSDERIEYALHSRPPIRRMQGLSDSSSTAREQPGGWNR